MSKLFLLDENVLVWPIAGCGSTEGSVRAARLWVEIARNCHRILVSPLLFRKYVEHLRELRSKLERSPIVGLAKSLWYVINEKSEWVEDRPGISEERLIRHQNDRYLAAIAVQRPGYIIVSLERSRQTLEDFRRAEFATYGICAVELEEALQLARQPS